MQKITYFIKNNWPILIITLVEIVLFFLNYTSKTYLIGWDNLFPEFNFGLNFKRAIFGVWQEYRGLGYEDGMSHAANLPHYFLIYLLSFIFPQNMLRYVFIIIMHWFGGVGIYLLLKHVLHEKHQLVSQLTAFIGALFYQFSFATIQMFYLPFELFITHFGYLPWLILTLTQYLKTGRRKTLVYFALLSFLASPQAHVPTIFIVYLMILAIFLLFHLISHRRAALKHVIAIVLVTLCTNAYWALPFAYSTTHNAQIIANSKNNQMATDDIFLKNHEYGDLANTALMRSFSLEFVQYDHLAEKSDLMLRSWIDHINQPYVLIISWVFFGLALVGGVYAIYKRKKELYPFVALFFFVFAVIGNDIPVISIISHVLRSYVPLFHSIFRFVFTKFFFVYAFSYAILVAVSLGLILEFIVTRVKALTYGLAILFIGLIGLYTLPAFKGHFFHRQLKVEIPQEYFDAFAFFKEQPKDERIAVLPAPWYWGWTQYNWGVIGSGFQWFGIEQPILDRAFDPWSQQNENFYWEVSQALYVADSKRLEAVLEKYDVSWVLVDPHIINPEKGAGNLEITFLQNGENISDKITFVTAFNRIKLYKVARQNKANNFVSLYKTAPNIGPTYLSNDFDRAASESAVYVTDQSQAFNSYYPFRSLFSGKTQKDLEFIIEEQGESLVFRAELPKNSTGYTLQVPSYDTQSMTDVNKDNWETRGQFYPTELLDGQSVYSVNETNASSSGTLTLPASSEMLEIVIPKVYGYYSYNSDAWNDFEREKKSCNTYNTGVYEHELLTENDKKVLRLTSVNSSNCLDFPFDYLPQRYSYLVTLQTKNISGKGMFFSITNKQSDRTFLETYLDNKPDEVATSHFIIPPLEPYSLGYSLNFDNISIGRVKTVNELRKITVHQIPYDFLVNLKLVKPRGFGFLGETTTITQPQLIGLLDVAHPNPAEYWVNLSSSNLSNSTLVLSQGYNPNWLAFVKTDSFPYFSFAGKQVMVNNWANGWKLDDISSGTVYILFWPQILQWIGFALLPLPFLWAMVYLKYGSPNSPKYH